MKDRTPFIDANGFTLSTHLMSQCMAMVKYALASGLRVPSGLVQDLEDIGADDSRAPGDQIGVNENEANSEDAKDRDMLPVQRDQTERVKTLASIHSQLAEILAPATPRTVLLLENEARIVGFWGFLGPVGLIRRMMLLAILFLVGLVAIAVTPQVNADNIALGIFLSDGWVLLLNLGFLFTASGLGGCFAGLFQASRFVANSTFDPKYESSYWIKIVLGLMAGMILAELVPLDFLGGDTGDRSIESIGKPLLALLGGFSAAAVYRIIARMVDSLESLVRGDTKEAAVAQENVTKAKFGSKLTENRLGLAANLTRLRQKIGSDTDLEEIRRELDKVLDGLIDTGSIDARIK